MLQNPYHRRGTLYSRAAGAVMPYVKTLARNVVPFVGVPTAAYATKKFMMKSNGKAKASISSNANSNGPVKKRRIRRIKPRKTLKAIARDVRQLKQEQEREIAIHTAKYRDTGRVLSLANQCSYLSVSSSDAGSYETILSQLRYYDPSSPSTLVNADGTTGTYDKNFNFTKIYAKMNVRNNYQVPCKVTIFVVKPKQTTSISPITAYTNGLSDVGNPTSTSPLLHLTDSPQFNDLWKIESSVKKVLQPGEELSLIHTQKKPSIYDPSLTDSQTQTYQTKFYCRQFVIRVEGILGHDTSADEQGTMLAGVDYQQNRRWEVHYDAGIPLNYLTQVDLSDSFTNGGVCSQKPIPDNIAYSVS